MSATIIAIKLLDIAYVSMIYFFLIYVVSVTLDKYIGPFVPSEHEHKSKMRLFIEIGLHFGLLGIIGYLLRNTMERIPFPLDGFYGFQHQKLKELGGGLIASFLIFYFQEHLKKKLRYFAMRDAAETVMK